MRCRCTALTTKLYTEVADRSKRNECVFRVVMPANRLRVNHHDFMALHSMCMDFITQLISMLISKNLVVFCNLIAVLQVDTNSTGVNLVYFPIFNIIRGSFSTFFIVFFNLKIVFTPRLVLARNVCGAFERAPITSQ